MRILSFIGLLLVLVSGALGCGQATSTTAVTAVTVTAAPTTPAPASTTETPTTATTYTSAIGLTTTTHNRLTDPTYSNVTTTEATRTTIDVAYRAFVEPYIPFVEAVFYELAEMDYEEDEALPFGMGGFGFHLAYDERAQRVILETPISFSDYVKFRDVYDERAWRMTRAVAAFYIDHQYVDLLEGNPLPSWRLSVDGIVYEMPAEVMTGIARNEVSKEDWLRTTGR